MDKVKKVPVLRFPGFSGEWEVKELGEEYSVLMCKRIFAEETNENEEIPFYKIGTLGKNPDVFISRKVFEEYKSKYNYPRKGEILITCSGTVGKCIPFDGNDSYYQDSNIVWIDNPKLKIKNELLYYLFCNINWVKLNSTTITRIYSSDLKSLVLKYPKESEEQQKIYDFISQVDHKIERLIKKKQLLESYKKGAMQKIFSQELRFKYDNGENYPNWGEKKLWEISSFHRGADLSKSDIVENGLNKCIHYGELFTTYVEVIGKIFSYTNKDNLVKSKVGDILMPSSDVTPQGLAKASCIMEDDVILGGDINIIRPNDSMDSIFLSYQLNYLKYEIIKLVTGTTVKHIYFKDIKELSIKVPELKNEQTKIANFLTEIDNKINHVTKQLEGTKQFKKGLLQKMFI